MTWLVAVGDGVLWGQGLHAEHKPATLVAEALRDAEPALKEHLAAHAGAVLGIGTHAQQTHAAGEVPLAQPTVLEQLDTFEEDTGGVRVLLINGGLNDIGLRTILNPFVPLEALRALTVEHCYHGMRALLGAAVKRYPSVGTTIVVTSYYPLISTNSKPFRVPQLLEVYGLHSSPELGGGMPFADLIAERCLLFWRESTTSLQAAVDDVNLTLSTGRVYFADPGFREENAAYADDPWIWGLNPDLSPQDDVTQERRAACDQSIPSFDPLAREQCYRATAGLPNRRGARKYADAILSILRPALVE